ncbi:MAG: AarF/ABC1/UbiB kinase family protein [Acidobacteria bacterium]|nr:MAG: AarF/ABC1/UbiB kinase family protein [Acidobacteriota bacterium]REK00174.1 MAG: AarF/ABC1/UbiB kinase family protein [Acidobacteriota bacterium]
MAKLTLVPRHMSRYREIARLCIKFGRRDWVRDAGLDEVLGDEGSEQESADAEELADELEKLGPTFVKLGQVLSTRGDLLPPAYVAALERLQDEVEPFPFEEVQSILADELGVRVSKAFDSFDARPLAAASLGQVHTAVLRDGRPVAVKVQRPGVRKKVLDDLDVLDSLAELLDRHTSAGRRWRFGAILEGFRKSLLAELNYEREAQNLITLADNLGRFEHLAVPRPIGDYTSQRVLTMERIDGVKLDDVSPVVLAELDGEGLADELFEAYLSQILIDGFFHADPHPGNVLLSRHQDVHRIHLIDLGMVGRVGTQLRDQLLKLLLALAEGQGEEAARITIEASEIAEGADLDGFVGEVTERVLRYRSDRLEDLQVGQIVLEMAGEAAKHGVWVPQVFNLIGKTLLSIDHVGRRLAPRFDPNAAIRRHATRLISERMSSSLSLGEMYRSLLEASEFAQGLPARLNRLLTNLSENRLRVEVDAIDERRLMVGMEKVANRITAGLVLAALIVGAALLMRVETSFQILGYPGFAIVLFLVAAAGGFRLLWAIHRDDRLDQRR